MLAKKRMAAGSPAEAMINGPGKYDHQRRCNSTLTGVNDPRIANFE